MTTVPHLPRTTQQKKEGIQPKSIVSNILLYGGVLLVGVLAAYLSTRRMIQETLGPDLKPAGHAFVTTAEEKIVQALRRDPTIQAFCQACDKTVNVYDVDGKPAVKAKNRIVEELGHDSTKVEIRCGDFGGGNAVLAKFNGDAGYDNARLCDWNAPPR